MSDPDLDSAAQGATDAQYLELSRNLRRLASQLVREDATADDVVQEAWLAALDEPADRVRDLNAWLRRVVRNVAARTHQRARRRHELERAAARAEGVEAADPSADLSAGPVAGELLRECVAALREPYRTVLTLRFLDGLAVGDVARRLGRSPGTVRSQVRRGLGELRLALDRRHGGRRDSWLPAVAALGGAGARHTHETAAAGAAGAAGAGGAWVVAAFGGSMAALAALVTWLALRAPERMPEPAGAVAVAEAPAEAPEETLVGAPSPAGPREAGTAGGEPPAVPPATAAPPAPPRLLEVDVRRADGSVPDDASVRVWVRDVRLLGDVRADARGRATIPVAVADLVGAPWVTDPTGGVLVAVRAGGEAWSHQHSVRLPEEGRRIEIRTRGPAQTLRIVVEDGSGDPIPGAKVVVYGGYGRTLVADGHPLPEQHLLLDVDERGELALEGRARSLHRLRVRASGFAEQERSFQGNGDVLEARFVLSPGGAVYGRVVHADGRGAPGARVWKPDLLRVKRGGREQETTADEGGSFELPGLAPGRHRLFTCSAEDPELFASAVLEVAAGDGTPWNATLAPEPPIRVRILDELDRPIEGAVALLSNEDRELPWASLVETDAGGRASFRHNPEGRLTLLVRRANRAEELVTEHEVQRTDGEVVIRLEPRVASGAVKGVLLDPGGQPWSGKVMGAFGNETFGAPTVPDTGEFVVRNLFPGPYELSAVSSSGAHRLGVHEVLPGATCELDVVRVAEPVPVAVEWLRSAPSQDSPWVLRVEVPGFQGWKEIRVVDQPAPTLSLLPGRYELAERDGDGENVVFEVGEERTVPVRVGRR